MKILYFGTSLFAIPPLRALVDNGHTVTVVTQPDRPAGRGSTLSPPPVKVIAEELYLPLLQPESCRAPEFIAQAHALSPELIVVAAYGQFLPDTLLAIPPYGAVNLHGSLLPRYRGAAPIQRAILHGEERTGVCLMWMVRAMDAGDIIVCAETPIHPDDTAGTLAERLAELGATLLLQWLPALAHGTAPHDPQDPALVTFAPPISKEEREIAWSASAVAIQRQVRAFTPTPIATTHWRGEIVKVLEVAPATADISGDIPAGEILSTDARHGLLVMTGEGVLQILRLQPAGKRPMSGADFLRGQHLAPGARFDST